MDRIQKIILKIESSDPENFYIDCLLPNHPDSFLGTSPDVSALHYGVNLYYWFYVVQYQSPSVHAPDVRDLNRGQQGKLSPFSRSYS